MCTGAAARDSSPRMLQWWATHPSRGKSSLCMLPASTIGTACARDGSSSSHLSSTWALAASCSMLDGAAAVLEQDVLAHLLDSCLARNWRCIKLESPQSGWTGLCSGMLLSMCIRCICPRWGAALVTCSLREQATWPLPGLSYPAAIQLLYILQVSGALGTARCA